MIDVVVVGAGAAGLMAAIQAARAAPDASVVALDGAKSIGAKILVAGGGRCNVTHFEVGERAFAGSTPAAIRKVLRRFDVAAVRAFFEELGVELKREETGKLFPTTDRARTVLDALLRAAQDAGVDLRHPWRVESVTREGEHFVVTGPEGRLQARRVILATGGKSLPKSGSDGHGYAMVRSLGHSTTPRLFQSLVPLLLPDGYFVTALRGVATPVSLRVQSGTGKTLHRFEGPLLCTHFGISGPAVLDISRYYLDAHEADSDVALVVNWLPGETRESLDRALIDLRGAPPMQLLEQRLPVRLAKALCEQAGVDTSEVHVDLTKKTRKRLVAVLTEMPLPVTGPRGWTWAEVTAGGVPLRELDLKTLASRVCPGLYVCGEICDVDGRIGGFNFQWAWSSGYVAGRAAVGA